MKKKNLNELIAEQKVKTEEKSEAMRPANAEEKSFKKRYGDLTTPYARKEKVLGQISLNYELNLTSY